MKKTLNEFRSKNLAGPLIALCLLVFTSNLHAQIFVKDKDGKTQTVATQEWVQEYFKSLQNPTPKPEPIPDTRPDCKVGLTLISVVPGQNQLEFNFHSLDVQSIDYKIRSGNAVIMSGNTGQLTSSKVFIPHALAPGNYTLQIKAVNCKSDSVSGIKPFTIAQRSGKYNLTPLKDPLLPEIELTGDYELRYLESREDEHLKLSISLKDGQIYLSDTSRKSLQSASYTLNGWTDLENCGKLENEPIRPYREYHLLKFSIAASNIKDDFWRADSKNTSNTIAFKRSEVFFFVVPKGSTWNPAGESPNPIGRPAAFDKIPAFQLKNRTYGFEYDFNDESGAKLDDLNITFNRKKGQRHLKLYSSVLTAYLKSLPVRKGFEELSEKECVDFANTLPIEKIVAFDIEPGEGNEWIINYDGPNFTRNMAIVIERLKQRGAMAYNWLDTPSRSPNVITFEGTTFGTGGNYGKDLDKFSKMYKHIDEVKRRSNPYSVISTGYGYAGYDANFSQLDGSGNVSPQLTYLRALDVAELWQRVWPEKEQVYFSWPFQEFNVIDFPRNHIVEIPEFNARARRTDNKPLYPPNQWHDNLTLGLINAKYLFYWCPGPVGWNPSNTSQYNNTYTSGFSVWTFEQGKAPLTSNFYIGKEAMAINATIKAAYTFSQIQDAMDGSRTAPKFTYKRATKDGSVLAEKQVPEITDGSWYNESLIKQQPFVIFCKNGNNKALLVQDVWARPGRWTEFEIEIEGKVYTGITEGNRLFVAKL